MYRRKKNNSNYLEMGNYYTENNSFPHRLENSWIRINKKRNIIILIVIIITIFIIILNVATKDKDEEDEEEKYGLLSIIFKSKVNNNDSK